MIYPYLPHGNKCLQVRARLSAQFNLSCCLHVFAALYFQSVELCGKEMRPRNGKQRKKQNRETKMREEKKLSSTGFLESASSETCKCLLCYERDADHKATTDTPSAADSCQLASPVHLL